MRRLSVTLLLLVLAACGSSTSAQSAPSSETIPGESGSGTSESDSPLTETAQDCGGEFPVFLPSGEPLEGTPGVGPGASPALEGQLARHWRVDQTVSVDVRWPYGEGFDPAPRPFTVIESRQIGNGIVVVLDIGGPAGCDLIRVEVHGDGVAEQLYDVAAAFSGDARPIDQLDDYLDPPATEVVTEPSAPAVRVVEQFLEAAGAGEYEFAAGALFNEGVSPAVEAKLGLTFDNWDRASELLTAYCADALCGAPYSIIGVVRSGPRVEAVLVEFEDDGGPVEWRVPVGQFEGMLTLGDVPPLGAAEERPGLSERIFGSDQAFTAVWYDAAQLITPGNEQWARWWTARYGRPDVVGRWGLTDYVDSLSVEDLVGEFETERIPSQARQLVGSGVLADRELAFLSSGDELLEVDLASLDVEPLMTPGDPEGFVGTASAAGTTLAVTMGVGDSAWVEFYDSDLGLITSTRGSGTYVSAALDPTGDTAAVVVETELHMPRRVAMVDVATGAALASWDYDGSGVIADIAFNGTFIVAAITETADRGQPPRLFVVNTDTGAIRIVATAARVRF